ncbi:MAG: DNA (cytosine-5-)-methyltransferase [Candidatus Omnitrophica bacterium]|nr:DNA (cytosine-5-)-methyltransferase [Candidatus Omnitrophota bacterium]
MRMVKAIPSGGNWKNIPVSVPSKRLEQIRKSGGRTTYYGRLKYDAPAYTVSTFFNRPGNGCYIHPDDGRNNKRPQHRVITFREAARLQSFPDDFVFVGTKTAQLKQVGNAVPPVLGRAIASGIKEKTFVDLFCGVGGLSLGFLMTGKKLLGALDNNAAACNTFKRNHKSSDKTLMCGDVTSLEVRNRFVQMVKSNLKTQRLGMVIGGAPCQGFSLAGNRLADDPRNKLFMYFVELVKELNPKVFVFENVPGLLSIQNGRVVSTIVRCFRDLGYNVVAPVVLKAEEYGVPQKRRRLFILGSKDNATAKFPPQPLFGPDSHGKYTPITVHDAISDLPPIHEGLGNERLELNNYSPISGYQKFMAGIIGFKEFYQGFKSGRLKHDGKVLTSVL